LLWGWSACQNDPVPLTTDASEAPAESEAGGVRERVRELYDRAGELAAEGRHAEAVRVAGEAVGLAREHLGPELPDLGYCLRRMADSLEEVDDAAGALDCWQGALSTFRRACGERHPTTSGAWYHAARLLRRAGRRE